MEYIQSNKTESGCVFCSCCEQPDGPENLIVARGQHSFVILNRFPYTSGHLMVVPYDHVPSLEQLEPDTRAEIMEQSARVLQVLASEYHPQGFNLGINIGEAAGAGILDHVHLHIVPRWAGDTNFMSSVAATRVLPEKLDDTYWRIRSSWEQPVIGDV
jgi:ATP adenylyltransferase